VLEPLAYARVVERIGNEENVIDIDLEDVVPRTVQMTVSVSAATTDGQPLPQAELEKVLQACRLAQTLDADRAKLQRFVGSRMSLVAPNLSAVCGAEVAAKLVGAAGGLLPLSNMPACNIQVRPAPLPPRCMPGAAGRPCRAKAKKKTSAAARDMHAP
jgi:U4/U6 small nuclear ribonucleoprotein PRP31